MKIYNYFKKHPVLIVLFIFVFWSVLNLIYIYLNKTEPNWDMARHLWTSLYYNQLINYTQPIHDAREMLLTYLYYPPLVYIVTKPFYLFDRDIIWAISSNILWLGILIFSIYGIANKIWNKNVGLLSVVILAATPIFIGSFKEYMLDGPLAAWVALTVYLLIKTENFSKQPYNLLLGLVLGMGMLIKWTYIAFVIFPVIYFFIAMLIIAIKNKKIESFCNFIFVIITAITVFYPWYYNHHSEIYRDYLVNATTTTGKIIPVKLTDIYTWLYYLVQGFNFYFYIFLGFIVYSAVLLSIFVKKYRSRLMIGSLLVPWLIFTVLTNKDVRYLTPALPFAILLTANVILSLKYKKILIWIIIILGLFYQIDVLTGWFKHKPITIPIVVKYDMNLAIYRQNIYMTSPPSKVVWHANDIVKTIKNRSSNKKVNIVLTGQQVMYFNFYTLSYYGKVNSLEFDLAEQNKAWQTADFGILMYSDNPNDILSKMGINNPNLVSTYQQPDGSFINLYDLR